MSVKTYRRGVILICAALCGALTASLNIWSIFQKPLMEAYGFSPQSVSFAYTIVIAMIGLSGPIGGWLQRKAPEHIIMTVAGIGFGLGWFLTGFASTIPVLYISFGLLVGVCDGICYNLALAIATRWYPDKRGFANGVALAEECCALVGEALNIPAEDVLPASTGVIGQPMVVDPFARGIPAAAAKLTATAQGSTDAATAIMTTDTHKKEYAIQFELGGKTCTVGAIGKGSGMIAPNMATMLAFYTTDAAVSPALLAKALKTVVPGTYNQMSVDLDTSTNDTLIIMASGLAGNPEICEENADYDAFVAALTAIAEHMCAEHAGDGEGATHLITCEVTHAPDLKTARAVSRSVVCSNLFKAAVFGRDANWGRILCAIGYTPGDFSIDKVCVWLSSAAGEVYVCENAAYHPYSEDEAAKVLAEHDILVKVDMGTGDASAKAWGCDLTYDYVKINGDYRT